VPLTPGIRVGPYEVMASIGAGGMGEVDKSRDTRLKREIALKIKSAGGTITVPITVVPNWAAQLEK
jgi:hypothetical protein